MEIEQKSHAPFRQAEVRTRCAFCHELTDGATRCLRCGRPLCAVHATADDRRCASCEEELAAQLARAALRAMRVFWIAGLSYIGVCVVGGISGSFTKGFPEWAGAVIGVSPIGFAVAFFALSIWLERAAKRRRRRFLRERAPARPRSAG